MDNRQRIDKASIIDIALEYCVRDNRKVLKFEDIREVIFYNNQHSMPIKVV